MAIGALRQIVVDVIGCVLRGPRPIISEGREPSDYDLVIGSGMPYPLAGPARLSIHARMRLRTSRRPGESESWRVEIVAYQYTLLDADEREIVAFHLHPEGSSHVVTPHLHLGTGAGRLRADLAAAHVPTGPVTLAAVARLAIEGFSAQPQRGAWDATLRRADVALGESRAT